MPQKSARGLTLRGNPDTIEPSKKNSAMIGKSTHRRWKEKGGQRLKAAPQTAVRKVRP